MTKPKAGASGKKKPAAKKAGEPKAKKAARPVEAQSEGGGRQLISKAHLRDLADVYDKCKGRMSTLAGELGQTTKDYVDKGLNNVAFTLMNRIRRTAQRDPVKAAILFEDFQYYMEALEIEKMFGKSMLPKQPPQTKPRGSRAKAKDDDAETTSGPDETGEADAAPLAAAGEDETAGAPLH
jgi:hypothetical protein